MCHERLREVKEILLCCVEEQVQDLCAVDTEELGEVIDMIKDLEEAIYYCTITEAMNSEDSGNLWEMKKSDHHQWDDSRVETTDSWNNKSGKSYMSRHLYMEAKHNDSDKSVQLRELEKYAQELTQDIVEMISDATLEEKQYMEKKITALASKIG
jgi:hypothetical protein